MTATLVIVEDDLMLAEIYQTRMQLAGYTTHVANDGLTGLQLIQDVLPDLVLLDLMLPQMSGDEVLRNVRGADWGQNIKVIILTNISEAEAPVGLETLHFERYIVKANLVHDQLDQIVAEILGTGSDSLPALEPAK